MAKRKLYTANQLVKIRNHLMIHCYTLKTRLITSMSVFGSLENFDAAIDVRDDAQKLATALLGLDNMDLSIKSATNDGPRILPFDPHDIDFTVQE